MVEAGKCTKCGSTAKKPDNDQLSQLITMKPDEAGLRTVAGHSYESPRAGTFKLVAVACGKCAVEEPAA